MSAVAIVTGAARGVGRGVALMLAETGATVYVTDIETRAQRRSPLPGTVEDTAEQVGERGGTGIPVAVDHTDDDAVAALFARVADEQDGRLDLLVANACNGNALPFGPAPFWELPIVHWRNMVDAGVRGHVVAAQHAARLMIARGRGLIVLTGYVHDGDEGVLGNHLFYDLAMHATSRAAHCIAHDLLPHGVTALTLSPGFTATEAIEAALGPNPPGADPIDLPGRAVRALLADRDVAHDAGRTLTVAQLSERYGLRGRTMPTS